MFAPENSKLKRLYVLKRWYCVEASEAITAWGKDFLMKTMEKAEKHGLKPVYADTDGFFVTYAPDQKI